MKLGIANHETWIFIEDICAYLSTKYETKIFERATWSLPIMQPKMSHYMLRKSLNEFIHSCDVVLFEWASELLVEASSMKTPQAASLVVRLHRYEMFQWTHRINWENVSYVILDTHAMRKKLLERTDLPPERALVLPNAVPLYKTNSSHRPFKGNIGVLSTLIPRKRIYEFILGFYALQKQEPDLMLHIGGNTQPSFQAYYEALHDLIEKLGIQDKVKFYGRVDERWDWYQKMDVFVSYSYSEGMPVAPIEAIASGCYCLSHWWAGAEEIFPEDQLFITEDEFVEKMLSYIRTTDEEREKISQPLRDFVLNNCNLSLVSEAIEDVLIKAYKERTDEKVETQHK
ncbi:MAG: glycosyltransferase family 4 protein [Anaerolineae bacterium]|nr:glycosyltransferase family 4 protein [Anaerolineae bacterium]